MEETFTNDDKSIIVLKGCTQSPLAMAAVYLKGILTMRYLFKDVRGKWTIKVDANKDCVRISHIKSEQSVDQDESQFFFTWKFEIILHPTLQTFSSYSIQILTLEFGTNTQETHQNEIRTLLKPFL
jgi:hypothetical protein